MLSNHELPWALRDLQGAPMLHLLGRHIVGLPGPPIIIWMPLRRAIKVLSCPSNCIGHLMAQVLVFVIQGPNAHQVPHDLVGPASPDVPRLRKEHQVQLGLVVQLQDLEDEVPKLQGILITFELDLVPIGREALSQELEVVPLEVPKGRVLQELHPPQGRQGPLRWHP